MIEFENRANNGPMQAQFLKAVLQEDKIPLPAIKEREIKITEAYWGVVGATCKEVGELFGISKHRTRVVVKKTMGTLWDNSTPDIKASFPLERIIQAKSKKEIVIKPETRAKLRAASSGRSPSAETRTKIGASLKGRHPSDETRSKIGAASKGRPSPMRGKFHSTEAKAKMSAANKGKPSPLRGRELPTAVKTKISIAKMGHEVSCQTRIKISLTLKDRFLKLNSN